MKDDLSLVDSNILVYAFDSSEKAKHQKARELLKDCWLGNAKYAVSIQNLSEFFVIATRKISKPMPKEDASDIAKKMIEFNGFIKLEPAASTVSKALGISLENNVSYWDALIAATMIENGIFDIYTENTKDFSKIAGIKAKNPFI